MTTNAAHDPVYKVTTTHYWAGCCSCSQSEVLLVEMKGTPVCVPWVNDMLHLLLALLSNRTLVTLEMGTNGLTDATAEKLGLALKANNKLEGLSLWQNDITAEVSH